MCEADEVLIGSVYSGDYSQIYLFACHRLAKKYGLKLLRMITKRLLLTKVGTGHLKQMVIRTQSEDGLPKSTAAQNCYVHSYCLTCLLTLGCHTKDIINQHLLELRCYSIGQDRVEVSLPTHVEGF